MAMKDSVHLVYGATGGIGEALTKRLAERGAKLMLAGRSQEELSKLCDAVDAKSTVIESLDAASIESAAKATLDTYGRIDGVANCIGSMLLKPAHLISDTDWEETIRVNLYSCFAITRVIPKVMTPEGGSVVFFSSVAAGIGLPNHEAIAAAKAGVTGLALSAASTYASKKIRFNVVAPGLTRTSMTERITSNEASLKASIQMHPLGRIGEPGEIAAAAEWFLDPAQSWVTGQVLGVDGGLGAIRNRIG